MDWINILGSSGFTNASDFTRRHADLGLQKIRENADFIKNAENVKFEELANYDGIPNAIADIDFVKEGKRYVGEFKAGDAVITSNFHTQCINYFQRVTDLRNFKLFRRPDVILTKQTVIYNWVSKGVVNDESFKNLVRQYANGLTILI
ncbi:hypothetical protein [Dyadobacter sp. NIV53]|uniref:hypothetical protein n=1 Tax=Dyadobacter sp. NIV53 TaxID=2861765 RepID=UPI001C87E82C|nr:hypothetical protein [Dyadobacter sp. NIV53]